MNCKNCSNLLPENAKFCNKCGKPVDSQEASIIEYFAISPKRLILLSILTGGVYEMYWFYKNWEAVKKFEGQKISPLGRTIFAIFYCKSLFRKVLESAKSHGYQNFYSPAWLTTAYILLFLITGMGLTYSSNAVWSLVGIFGFIPLIPIQKAINFNNEKVKDALDLKRDFSRSEALLVIYGTISFVWSLTKLFKPFFH